MTEFQIAARPDSLEEGLWAMGGGLRAAMKIEGTLHPELGAGKYLGLFGQGFQQGKISTKRGTSEFGVYVQVFGFSLSQRTQGCKGGGSH